MRLLPPIAEQRRVASALDSASRQADKMLANARRAVELVRELRLSHLQKAFGSPRDVHERLNPVQGLGGLISLRGGGAAGAPADFYVQRSGTTANVGRPFMEAFGQGTGERNKGPGDTRHHIGVTVLRPDVLDPRYLYYVAEYAWRAGIYRRLCHGTLNLQHLRLRDVSCGLQSVIGGPRKNPMSSPRPGDRGARDLERRAAGGDPEAAHALFRLRKRTGEALWIEIDGEDRRWITGVNTDWPGNMGQLTLEKNVEEGWGGNTLIVAEDEYAAGEGHVEMIRNQVANDPDYPRRMVPQAVAAWARGEAGFTGEAGMSGGLWYPTLNDWIDGHADYPEMLDGGGLVLDVDEFHPGLAAVLGFDPGVAFRG